MRQVILFCFSKKDCEALALSMYQLDLADEEEKKLIEGIFSSAIDNLSEEDKRLPQVGHAGFVVCLQYLAAKLQGK